MIEERKEFVVPKTNLETQDDSNSKGVKVGLSIDMPSPTPARRACSNT